MIAVGGGKGGIGKTFVSASLAIRLAQLGIKVVAVDLDLGAANLHTSLGIDPPAATLSDFVERRVERIEDIAVQTGVPNLTLISGAQDALDVANPKVAQKMKLIHNLQRLDADFVVLDLGAGTSFNTLDFFLVADHGLLVLAPEPTSIENGYRFIKAAFFRRMGAVLSVFGIGKMVEELIATRASKRIVSPFDLIEAVKKIDRRAGLTLEAEMRRFRGRLIINQARTDMDRQVGSAVETAWRRHFGLEISYLGAVDHEDEIWQSVRKRRAMIVNHPEGKAARAFSEIADRLLRLDGSLDRDR